MKKGNMTNILLVAVFFTGLSLLLYPAISDMWNSRRQSYAITHYSEQVAGLDREDYRRMWADADAYNHTLIGRRNGFLLDDAQKAQYPKLLDLTGTGVMGYIEIPKIGCSLPLYHGTDEAVLQVAVGHIEWSSLPVGGESTHTVFSGHRGLPSAKLFTDLDEIEEGDIFMLVILEEVLTYQVDRISIVEPHESESLLIEEGKDLCTLVTCTPYGINSHRLLVRGHRVANVEETAAIRVVSDAIQIEPLIVATLLAVPIITMMMLLLAFGDHRRRKH